MYELFRTLIPVCLAAAVSPMMLSEQLVILAGPTGRRSAMAYFLGAAAVLVALGVGVLVLGGSLSLPSTPRLSAGLDIMIGTCLLLMAALWYRRPVRPKPPTHRRRSLTPGPALGFGVFSMATNFTTLALLIAASKDISASDVEFVERVVAVVVMVLLGTTPAWIPIVLERLSPRIATRALNALSTFISGHSRDIVVLALSVVGLLFVGKGSWHLANI